MGVSGEIAVPLSLIHTAYVPVLSVTLEELGPTKHWHVYDVGYELVEAQDAA